MFMRLKVPYLWRLASSLSSFNNNKEEVNFEWSHGNMQKKKVEDKVQIQFGSDFIDCS